MKNLFSLRDLSVLDIHKILDEAESFKNGKEFGAKLENAADYEILGKVSNRLYNQIIDILIVFQF